MWKVVKVEYQLRRYCIVCVRDDRFYQDGGKRGKEKFNIYFVYRIQGLDGFEVGSIYLRIVREN